MAKELQRTVFVVQHQTGMYYFCDTNMRQEPKRGFCREDTNISPERSVFLMQDLADFYGVEVLEGSFEWLPSFEVVEPGIFKSKHVTVRVLIAQLKGEKMSRDRHVIPVEKHKYFSRMMFDPKDRSAAA